MQGAVVEQPNDPISVLKSLYNERRPINEFFNISFNYSSISLDSVVTKAKVNIPRFSFYYLSILGLLTILFVISKPVILVPIIVAAACYTLSGRNIKVANYDVTDNVLLAACIVINLLIILASSVVLSAYLVLLGMLFICSILILVHSYIAESKERYETSDNNQI